MVSTLYDVLQHFPLAALAVDVKQVDGARRFLGNRQDFFRRLLDFQVDKSLIAVIRILHSKCALPIKIRQGQLDNPAINMEINPQQSKKSRYLPILSTEAKLMHESCPAMSGDQTLPGLLQLLIELWHRLVNVNLTKSRNC